MATVQTVTLPGLGGFLQGREATGGRYPPVLAEGKARLVLPPLPHRPAQRPEPNSQLLGRKVSDRSVQSLGLQNQPRGGSWRRKGSRSHMTRPRPSTVTGLRSGEARADDREGRALRGRRKDLLNADGSGDPRPSPCPEAPELRVSGEWLSLPQRVPPRLRQSARGDSGCHDHRPGSDLDEATAQMQVQHVAPAPAQGQAASGRGPRGGGSTLFAETSALGLDA